MSRDLKLSGKKQRTHDGYLREIRKLACFYNLPPDQLSQQLVGDYLLHLINERDFARIAESHLQRAEVFLWRHLSSRLGCADQAACSQTRNAA